MTIKQLFELMPNTTRVSIFDRDKCDTVYEGEILHCRGGYKESIIAWVRLGTNELIIDIEEEKNDL